MLSDRLRNQLLSRAIKRCVKAGTHFLDVGAGAGTWAILAAKLGAARVVAVESEECLIPVIFKHAQENGVARRIEIVHGRSQDVKVRGKFDVIVSELFGGNALGQETVAAFLDIRRRFLAPGGTLIPRKLALMAAPAFIARPASSGSGSPISAGFLRSLNLNFGRSVHISERGATRLLAKPATLVEIDFADCETAPSLSNLKVEWRLPRLSRANSIVAFNRSVFLPGTEMDSFHSQSWGATAYEFAPFEKKGPGELTFAITLDEKRAMWSVSVEGKTQNFSPAFGVTRVRLAQQTTPHRRFRHKTRPDDQRSTRKKK
jgi:SAM-dependent methyltransferase